MAYKRVTPFFFGFIIAITFSTRGNGENKIATELVKYTSGNDTVMAYLASPEGEGIYPALIVIHEWWGPNDWIKQNADEFARRGYVALAIDLYRGRVAGSSDEAHELMRGLPEDRAVRDLKAAFAYLKEMPNVAKHKIGSIGWCMGGGYSLAAILNINQLGAGVICYGRLVTETEEISKISCPVLGIFGEKDRGIPAASVVAFERAAQKLEKDVRVTVYPRVGHAFMNRNNKEGYDEKAASEAWRKIYAFLDSKLKARK